MRTLRLCVLSTNSQMAHVMMTPMMSMSTCMVGPALAGSMDMAMKKKGRNVPITHEMTTMRNKLRAVRKPAPVSSATR